MSLFVGLVWKLVMNGEEEGTALRRIGKGKEDLRVPGMPDMNGVRSDCGICGGGCPAPRYEREVADLDRLRYRRYYF